MFSSFPLPQGNNMSPHYFYSVVDSVSKSVLGSPVLIYIDDYCGHKIDAAAFDVIEELLAAMFKSCKFVIEACCECKIDAVGGEIAESFKFEIEVCDDELLAEILKKAKSSISDTSSNKYNARSLAKQEDQSDCFQHYRRICLHGADGNHY